MSARAAILVACLALPAVAHADPAAAAQVHVDKATLFYKEGKFADALTELNAAYAIDPQPQLLYAMGQIEVKLGQCDDAAIYYKRFVDATPAAAEPTKEALDTCRKQAAEPPPTEHALTPPPPTTPPTTPPPPTTTAPTAAETATTTWYSDHVADGLVASGVAALMLSGVFYNRALADLGDADAATTYPGQQASVDSAHSMRVLSVLFGLAGIGLTGAGIYHVYGTLYDRPAASVIVAPTAGGAAVSYAGRF